MPYFGKLSRIVSTVAYIEMKEYMLCFVMVMEVILSYWALKHIVVFLYIACCNVVITADQVPYRG